MGWISLTLALMLLGLICAILSAVFNGSFAAIGKIPGASDVHPFVFVFYLSIGVFVSSLAVIALQPLGASYNSDSIVISGSSVPVFAPFGILAGFLFVGSVCAAFTAIPLVGLSIAQGIWGGISIVVSFSWGVLAFPDQNHIKSLPLVLLGLSSLLAGVVVIAFCNDIGTFMSSLIQGVVNGAGERNDIHKGDVDDESDPLNSRESSSHASKAHSRRIIGFVFAGLVGVLGGSILVPQGFSPRSHEGLAFMPSFGVGAMLAGCVALIARWLWKRSPPVFLPYVAIPLGAASGIVWNIGNVLSLVAIQTVGYSVAYPILQCALFVGGLWGILVFREVRNVVSIAAFIIGAGVLLAGAALVAAFVGPTP